MLKKKMMGPGFQSKNFHILYQSGERLCVGIPFDEQQITITKLNEPSAFFVVALSCHSLAGAECVVSFIPIQNGRLPRHQPLTSMAFSQKILNRCFQF